VIVSGLPVFACVIILIKPRQRKAWQNQSNKNSNYNAYLAESIDGVRVSQLFDRQEVNISIMERLATACRQAWLRAVKISNTVWLSSETMTQLVLTFVYIAAAYWIGGGKMASAGVILAMTGYVSRFWQPITNLANIYNSFVNNIAYLERIFETMDEPVVVDDAPNAETLPDISGEIEFADVTFAYEEGVNVLEHMDLSVRAGESIALVGPTGAGKSTVCDFFRARGAKVLDCDGLYHEMLENDEALLAAIRGAFPEAFSGDALDRRALGRIVFSDGEKLALLNRTVLPLVAVRSEKEIEKAEADGETMLVLDAPTLFESGLDRACDLTLGVLASKETRIARIAARDGLTEEYARLRVEGGKGDAFYRARCAEIVTNDGDEAALKAQMDRINHIINIGR
jgi:ATP-binding cassette subfamily B protein